MDDTLHRYAGLNMTTLRLPPANLPFVQAIKANENQRVLPGAEREIIEVLISPDRSVAANSFRLFVKPTVELVEQTLAARH